MIQLKNTARLGGNLLQWTRCNYFSGSLRGRADALEEADVRCHIIV